MIMSAQPIAIAETLVNSSIAVSFRLLLGLYAVIPLCLLLRLLDSWFWQDYLLHTLPSSPYHFILFQIMFGTPHIIASAVLLVTNTDYLNHYKVNLIIMTLAIGVAYIVGNMLLPYRLLYVVVATWTVYHVLKQQYGVARGVCRLPEYDFNRLLGFSVMAGVCVYVGIFLRQSLDDSQIVWIKGFAVVFCAGLAWHTFNCQSLVTTVFGKMFLWSNALLVLTSFYLYVEGYYFFAILVPRFVHDATAYIFYVTHDYNKHHQQPQNALYRYAKRCGIHIFVVLPVISFSLAYVLQAYGDAMMNAISQFLLGKEFYKMVTVGLLGYLALMHYYTEAFTWKHSCLAHFTPLKNHQPVDSLSLKPINFNTLSITSLLRHFSGIFVVNISHYDIFLATQP
jgi:hypothetical protein